MSLRRWLNQPERLLFDAVVGAMAKRSAAVGAMRSIHPSLGKQAAASSDFQSAARYQTAIEVLRELDEVAEFTNLKIN